MKTTICNFDGDGYSGKNDFIWHAVSASEDARSVTVPYLRHEIIFNFGDVFSVNHDTSKSVLFVSGLTANPVFTNIEGKYEALGLMLGPLYFFQRFGHPVFLENYPAFDLADMIGPDILNLYEQIGNAETVEAKLHIAGDYFHQKRFRRDVPVFVLRFLDSLQTDHLRKGKVFDTAVGSGISSKHLIQTFRDVLGCTPHQYQRLFHFNRALHSLHKNAFVQNEHLASFFDQSHFSQIFRKFSGLTPSAYKKATKQGLVHASFPNTILLPG